MFKLSHLLLLAIAILGGCSVSSPSSEELVVRTQRGQYPAGAFVEVTLTNGSPSPIGANLCLGQLQKRTGRNWPSVATRPSHACKDNLVAVRPGESLQHTIPLPVDLSVSPS